jgi:hypothetical protein
MKSFTHFIVQAAIFILKGELAEIPSAAASWKW